MALPLNVFAGIRYYVQERTVREDENISDDFTAGVTRTYVPAVIAERFGAA